ncbi:hypothetical protein ALC53_09690 [Atta colombica]|uniref:Uncharacterized protein n=1 Tax=Atta colombica TaxID=520822 RepID=A0A195B5H9_9HYME|nr:hypothetical protein ALC53_09690 [Atta colombica]
MLRAILKMINNRKHIYSNRIKHSSSNAGYILSIRWVRSSVRNLAHWRSTLRIVKAKFVRLNSELFSEMGEYMSGEPRSVT